MWKEGGSSATFQLLFTPLPPGPLISSAAFRLPLPYPDHAATCFTLVAVLHLIYLPSPSRTFPQAFHPLPP